MIILLAPWWAAAAPPQKASGSGRAKSSPAASAAAKARPDTAIEADIRARFLKSKTRSDGFTVQVQGGVARIEGKTKVIQHKGVATRLAKSGGARAVDNRIEVDPAARERAAANLEKGRRRAQVKRGAVRTEPTAAQSKR